MNNYVDTIKLNNNIEKIKFFRDNLNTSFKKIEDLISDLNNNYKSNTNKNKFIINIEINNKKIIVYQFNKIKFLQDKLDKYVLASKLSKNALGG